jgi:glycosyltransferase involved in cell wall biosynthesis
VRILIASAWDPRSGVLTVYRALARCLASDGVRFSAFAFDGWSDDTLWTFCDELIDGRQVTLAEVLMSGRYDLLQCIDSAYSPPWGIETWVRRARFRGPIVLLGAGGQKELTGPTHATRYVAVSSAAASVLAEDACRPVAAVPSGYDETVFRPGPAPQVGRPVLVWVGRSFDPIKDVHLFLDLLDLTPEYDAVLVDSTVTPDADVRKRLDRLGARVRHTAFLDPEELAELYRLAAASGGAIVNTSRSEGFNCAIVEALACDCPVVAPRLAGLAHLIDGVNAALYDRREGADGAASALQRLADPMLRSQVVEAGRSEAGLRWTSRIMAVEYLQMYRDALAETRELSLRDRLMDPIARTSWRMALRLRPRWQWLTSRAKGKSQDAHSASTL